jgi:hypothetical protein
MTCAFHRPDCDIRVVNRLGLARNQRTLCYAVVEGGSTSEGSDPYRVEVD